MSKKVNPLLSGMVEWTWPPCATECEYHDKCGYCWSGPPTHCQRYQPATGSRADVAERLNAYLISRGRKGRVSA
jgi:hypothetical protein